MINNANAVRIKHELEEGAISEDTFKLLIPEFGQLVSQGMVIDNLDMRSVGKKHYCEVMLGGAGSFIIWANLYFTQKQAVAEYSIYDELRDKSINGKTHFTSISCTKSLREHIQTSEDGTVRRSAHFVEKVCKNFPVFGETISGNVAGERLYQEFARTRDPKTLKRLIAKVNSQME